MRVFLMKLTHIVMIGALGSLMGCGLKPGGCAFNDQAPADSTIIVKGPFTSLSNQTVTGLATVYRMNSDSSYVIRLEGVSIPEENGLLVRGTATPTGGSSTVAFETSVRGFCGTQNYVSTITDNRTWNQIAIFSPRSNVNYGVAALQ